MANRFFDYMHAGVPQLCNQYPEYEKANARFEIASLIAEPTAENIAASLNKMLQDEDYYQRLAKNCIQAREVYCWQEEEKTLINIYQQLLK